MNIAASISRFRALPSAFNELEIEISDPWHFNESGPKRIPLEDECGIYLYTQPGPSEWRLPLDRNENDVWYVGKSAGAIGGRAWSHVGTIYNPDTGKPWEPRFRQHRWSEVQSVPQSIRDSVACGEVVVYTVAITAGTNFALLAELLEKYVLVEYVLADGQLPPLNLQL